MISEALKIQLDHAKEEDEEERTVTEPLSTNLGANPTSSSTSIPGVYRATDDPSATPTESTHDDDKPLE